MKVLGIDTSAIVCSVALVSDDETLACKTVSDGLTHSETLLPLVKGILEETNTAVSNLDAIAVSHGPGSFTGLRIGVSAAKGLAWALDKPCAPCSTLESMAWQVAQMDGELCPVMDARRKQVYNARFKAVEGRPVRLTEDRAIALEDLAAEVKNTGKVQILVGDGAVLCYNAFREQGIPCVLAPKHLIFQTAWGVARQGLELARAGGLVSASALAPAYHRLSQAERERLSKLEKEPNIH